MYLVVTEPTPQVKDLVGAFICETVCSCPVDERSERGLTSGIEVRPESCFNSLQAASRSVHEVLERVVAIYEHLTSASQ